MKNLTFRSNEMRSETHCLRSNAKKTISHRFMTISTIYAQTDEIFLSLNRNQRERSASIEASLSASLNAPTTHHHHHHHHGARSLPVDGPDPVTTAKFRRKVTKNRTAGGGKQASTGRLVAPPGNRGGPGRTGENRGTAPGPFSRYSRPRSGARTCENGGSRTTPDRGQSSQETSPGPPRGRANLLKAFPPYLWWRLAQDRDVSRLFDEKNMKNRTAGQPEAVIYGTFAGNAGTPQRTAENRSKPQTKPGTDS